MNQMVFHIHPNCHSLQHVFELGKNLALHMEIKSIVIEVRHMRASEFTDTQIHGDPSVNTDY